MQDQTCVVIIQSSDAWIYDLSLQHTIAFLLILFCRSPRLRKF